MGTIIDKIKLSMIGASAGLALFSIVSATGVFGSKVIDEYTFKYHGKPAVVQHNDRRFGPDQYWITINGEDRIYRGTFTSDSGERIAIGNQPIGESRYKITKK